MVITFCGHSHFSAKENDEKQVLNLLEEISKGRQVHFYLGGYGGFDSFAKDCAKKFKATHPNARIIFVSPYINKWLDDRKEYFQKEYDEIIYPELENVPLKFAISKRNEWMINHADYVIAYVKTHYGGAYSALLFAQKHKKPYTNLSALDDSPDRNIASRKRI